MNQAVVNSEFDIHSFAKTTLEAATKFWFVVAVVGQWFMVYYVVVHYGGSIFAGNFEVLESPNGQTSGLFALIVHVALAVIIMGFGPLQLIPQIRAKVPRFHHFNGRLYIATVFIGSLIGLYMVWSYDAMPGGTAMFVAMNVMVLLILGFAIAALHHAIKRDITQHRKWALRLFMVVSAGWFFRVGLMAWIFINQGPVGFDPDTFEGPFIIALSFAQYLIPLMFLQMYFWARDKAQAVGKYAFAVTLFIATLIMGVGIAGAGMIMWLPNI